MNKRCQKSMNNNLVNKIIAALEMKNKEFYSSRARVVSTKNKIVDYYLLFTEFDNILISKESKYFLERPAYGEEIKLGYINILQGNNENNNSFKEIELYTKHTINLKNGLILPPCRITLDILTEKNKTTIKRYDMRRRFYTDWMLKDYSKIIPTTIFLE